TQAWQPMQREMSSRKALVATLCLLHKADEVDAHAGAAADWVENIARLQLCVIGALAIGERQSRLVTAKAVRHEDGIGPDALSCFQLDRTAARTVLVLQPYPVSVLQPLGGHDI